MVKSKIRATMLAHSVSPQDIEIATMELVFPRFILAELNTHRVFSKNSASSRAIPFKKMREMVINDPFIPIAWQKDHKGMQGTEYLSKTEKYNLISFVGIMTTTLHRMIEGSEEYDKLAKELDEKLEIIETSLMYYTTMIKTLDEWWLFARDKAVEAASIMYVFGATKQLCNRLLEPFMWHKVLLTATEFKNFFELRCPQYHYDLEDIYFKSRKDWLAYYKLNCIGNPDSDFELDKMDWYNINESQAEIHIQALAEAMWDAMGESIPKKLKAGEWHIPYGDNLNYHELAKIYAGFKDDVKLVGVDGWELTGFDAIDEPILKRKFFHSGIQVATARCARLSYQTVGDNPKIDYKADIRLHDILLKHHHMSPFEHCAQAMSNEEFKEFTRTIIDKETKKPIKQEGWLANFRGFKQYRHLI